jgi:hypothetical protein
MLKKNNFTWTTGAEKAFEDLKRAMIQAPILALPDFSKEFVVECDASGVGIGAVLLQERPIAFFSQALQGTQLLLSTYEKEMLALVMAVQKWRPYLLGRHFVVRSDQHSLKYLWTQKISTTAQQKWLYKLMGFDFSIEYKKGRENVVADALSRRGEMLIPGEFAAISSPIANWLDVIKGEIENDAEMKELAQRVQDGEAVGPWKYKEGILFFKERIYLPEKSALISSIIEQIHGGFHEGYQKTFQRIRANFYWKGMRRQIKVFIKGCEVCQRHKVESLTPRGLLQPLPVPERIWEEISMDFVDGLPNSRGKTTIFVVVDRLSKYAHFVAISHPYSAISVAQVFFENIFKLHGMPKSIVCDRDPAFTSHFWKELFQLQGTSFNFSSAYHPQTDGQTEVVNRTMEMYLRCFTSSQPKEWCKWLAWAEYSYNTSWHTTLKTTPFAAVYGRDPPTLLTYIPGTARVEVVERELMTRDQVLRELRENMKLAQERMKKVYDGKHREEEFEEGEWVFLKLHPYKQVSVHLRRSAKLAARFFGPFKIIKKISPVAYKLELPLGARIHPVFHVSLLKRYLGGEKIALSQLPDVLEDDRIIPKPRAVLEKRIRNKKHEVLIHWQGLSPAEATWEKQEFVQEQFPEFSLEGQGNC